MFLAIIKKSSVNSKTEESQDFCVLPFVGVVLP